MGQTKEQRAVWLAANADKMRNYNKVWRQTERGKRSDLNRHLIRKYGITIEEKEQMWLDQKGLCSVCHKPLPPITERDCQVDHCHKTNVVRGLLHWYCNMMVGLVENHPVLHEDVISYIQRCDSPISRE